MIQNSLLLAAALAGVAVTGNAFAYSPKDSVKPVITPAPRPIPSSVVKPVDLPRNFSGAVVNVEFTLDAAGQPRDIEVLRVSDPVLKRQLVSAFSQWRFETGASNAAASAKRFVLPIELQPGV